MVFGSDCWLMGAHKKLDELIRNIFGMASKFGDRRNASRDQVDCPGQRNYKEQMESKD